MRTYYHNKKESNLQISIENNLVKYIYIEVLFFKYILVLGIEDNARFLEKHNNVILALRDY